MKLIKFLQYLGYICVCICITFSFSADYGRNIDFRDVLLAFACSSREMHWIVLYVCS